MKIAVDGPAGAGKSSVAKTVAKKLNFVYIDTGAMYRAVTLQMLNNSIKTDEFDKIQVMLNKIKIDFLKSDAGGQVIMLNGWDVSDKIREERISKNVSEVSAIMIVREKLVMMQRKISQNKNVVMDGRDIGTVVLPDAEYKFFLDAKPEERAKRRFKELLDKKVEVSYDDILNSIILRDKKDSTRKLSPLKKADNAVYVDTTTLSQEQVVNVILSYVKKS